MSMFYTGCDAYGSCHIEKRKIHRNNYYYK